MKNPDKNQERIYNAYLDGDVYSTGFIADCIGDIFKAMSTYTLTFPLAGMWLKT